MLNPALSRSRWDVKKAELLRCGQPGLSRELHELEDWAEREILARGGASGGGLWGLEVSGGGGSVSALDVF